MRARLLRGTFFYSFCVAAVSALVACHDDRVLSPPLHIRPDLDEPQPGDLLGSYNPPTPPENNISYPDFQNTGIELPAGFPVRIDITGTLTFTSNDGYTACSQQSVPALPGGVTEIGPAGFDPAHQYKVAVGLGSATAPPGGGLPFQPQLASAVSVTAFTLGPGVL